MIHQISCRRPNNKVGDVGYWDDTEIPKTYHSSRSALRGQIFNAPQYKSAVGLNEDIIKQIVKYNITEIEFQIIGFEKQSFFIRIKVSDFIAKSKEVDFNYGKQRILSIGEFIRIYPEQMRLIENG